MCLPLRNLVVCFHKEGVSVAVPLYVSFDSLILEFSSSLREVMVHGGWAQEDGLEPQWKRFNQLSCGHGLGVYFEDVRRGPGAIIVAESSNRPFVEELGPLDRVV